MRTINSIQIKSLSSEEMMAAQEVKRPMNWVLVFAMAAFIFSMIAFGRMQKMKGKMERLEVEFKKVSTSASAERVKELEEQLDSYYKEWDLRSKKNNKKGEYYGN